MKTILDNILDTFTQINNIPRKSKNEKEISDWLVKWATENNFQVERDELLDVLITVPATKGYESKESVAIQGHMDMVCEKTPESKHDFSTDPIEMYVDNGWLKAEDTSLGADNGIALAIAMVLATEEGIKHPKLELLFTVDEETGLTGAVNLPKNWLKSKKLINIDSEDEGVFTIGCAGGKDAQITINYTKIANSDFDTALEIEVGSLKGGHSGVEIHTERGNANIILARLINKISQSGIQFGITSLSGGSAHNAIPRNSKGKILINSKSKSKCLAELEMLILEIKNEFITVDPKLSINISNSEPEDYYLESSIIDLLLSLPNGVIYKSQQMENVVETSCNIAVLTTEDSSFNLLLSQRSSVMSRLDEVCNKINSIVKLAGGKVTFGGGYQAWQPNFDSKMLQDFKDCYVHLFEKEPVIEVIHAGLECGVIGSKYPELDMISIGPTIKSPHSPNERMKIDTILSIWKLLVKYLEKY